MDEVNVYFTVVIKFPVSSEFSLNIGKKWTDFQNPLILCYKLMYLSLYDIITSMYDLEFALKVLFLPLNITCV